MRKLAFAVLSAVSLVTLGAPAYAVPVTPNGSFTVNIVGPNSTDTLCGTVSCITSATSALTFSGAETIGSFLDPFLGKPDNLSAANAPGFLVSGDPVTQSLETFPVNGLNVTVPVNDVVTACHGSDCIDFTFTSIHTATLSASGPGTSGTLALDLFGTFTSAPSGTYLLGQSADMTIVCTQTTSASAIVCGKSIDTPQLISTPEPASLAVLGSALFGFGWFRRRRRARA